KKASRRTKPGTSTTNQPLQRAGRDGNTMPSALLVGRVHSTGSPNTANTAMAVHTQFDMFRIGIPRTALIPSATATAACVTDGASNHPVGSSTWCLAKRRIPRPPRIQTEQRRTYRKKSSKPRGIVINGYGKSETARSNRGLIENARGISALQSCRWTPRSGPLNPATGGLPGRLQDLDGRQAGFTIPSF